MVKTLERIWNKVKTPLTILGIIDGGAHGIYDAVLFIEWLVEVIRDVFF